MILCLLNSNITININNINSKLVSLHNLISEKYSYLQQRFSTLVQEARRPAHTHNNSEMGCEWADSLDQVCWEQGNTNKHRRMGLQDQGCESDQLLSSKLSKAGA